MLERSPFLWGHINVMSIRLKQNISNNFATVLNHWTLWTFLQLLTLDSSTSLGVTLHVNCTCSMYWTQIIYFKRPPRTLVVDFNEYNIWWNTRHNCIKYNQRMFIEEYLQVLFVEILIQFTLNRVKKTFTVYHSLKSEPNLTSGGTKWKLTPFIEL